MEKLYNILKNLYNSDSRIMLYVYIAIAVVAVILVLIIIISSIRTKKISKIEEKPIIPPYKIPVVNNLEESVAIPEESPFKEEKPLILTETTPEIKPIPVREEVKIYDKPLELNSELDQTRPIQRVTTASDLLSEFLPEETLTKFGINSEITAEELNRPLPIKEEAAKERLAQPVYSSVFLDKKTNITLEPLDKSTKSKIQLELTPITPLKIDSINEPVKQESKELILEPKILKPEVPVKEVKLPKNDSIKKEFVKIEEKKNSPKELKLDEIKLPKEELRKEPAKVEEKVVKNNSPKEEIKKENQSSKKEEKSDNKTSVSKSEKHDESLDTKFDIFSHESIIQKNLAFDLFKPKTQEELLASKPKEVKTSEPEKSTNKTIVLSAEDLKSRLSLLQSKVNKKEESFAEVLREVGFDELSDLYEINREETRALRR